LKESCAEATNAKAEIGIGAQNVHAHLAGAFTGEISAGMLRECGVSFCIVGHSERRIYFEESDILIQQKARILMEHEIRPVICIGESLEQREKNLHEKNGHWAIGADYRWHSTDSTAPVHHCLRTFMGYRNRQDGVG
jgi:triosephosphate isomerase